MKFSVVDWARLICPTIGDGKKCQKYNVYGFKDILPDGMYPHGDSGEWLTKETLSIILAKYGIDHGYYSTFDNALKNPTSNQLWNPPLQDLVTRFVICPYNGSKQMEETMKKGNEEL